MWSVLMGKQSCECGNNKREVNLSCERERGGPSLGAPSRSPAKAYPDLRGDSSLRSPVGGEAEEEQGKVKDGECLFSPSPFLCLSFPPSFLTQLDSVNFTKTGCDQLLTASGPSLDPGSQQYAGQRSRSRVLCCGFAYACPSFRLEEPRALDFVLWDWAVWGRRRFHPSTRDRSNSNAEFIEVVKQSVDNMDGVFLINTAIPRETANCGEVSKTQQRFPRLEIKSGFSFGLIRISTEKCCQLRRCSQNSASNTSPPFRKSQHMQNISWVLDILHKSSRVIHVAR
ncbi:hypothetical protein MJG53_014562 [Ovis ammon polii x Ovis aries]|uniref:Uncharacterized protein n=1 Tax=Ovis ammon polii x Ovis aries TaxID=2918886 RepID=A0ACB9UH77_9CETA|nr:hypothetical protein MJG53_014562 [Ovis ammon polii x Ovis aries]